MDDADATWGQERGVGAEWRQVHRQLRFCQVRSSTVSGAVVAMVGVDVVVVVMVETPKRIMCDVVWDHDVRESGERADLSPLHNHN
jgi:hypothetical protein